MSGNARSGGHLGQQAGPSSVPAGSTSNISGVPVSDSSEVWATWLAGADAQKHSDYLHRITLFLLLLIREAILAILI
jgi:hypothetical protein